MRDIADEIDGAADTLAEALGVSIEQFHPLFSCLTVAGNGELYHYATD
jgi:hypothetical protein